MDNTNQLIPPMAPVDSKVNIASGEDGGDIEWVTIPLHLPQETYIHYGC